MTTTILGYQLSKKLHESSNSVVYRGYQKEDNKTIILKLLKQQYPSSQQIAWFKREYELTNNLNINGVVKAYKLKHNQQQWAIVLEDFGGESLLKLLENNQITLDIFFPLAIQIADILGQIHQHRIIHKDINPSNIIFNASTNQVKLIDFGISTILSHENPIFRNPNVLQGTLAYMSPEQTGRMNRMMDYRTDYYSLGVTFYQLLSSSLPFPTTDPMELIHAHIAKQPIPPHHINSDIPIPLSNIIMKLLAKNAQDRYQSTRGLKADLTMCLSQWQQLKQITDFPLGQYDISSKFQISQKLYGRQAEIDILLAAFERITASDPTTVLKTNAPSNKIELVLVAGYAGIGKSALVQEIYRPITRQRGYFISGKFDQLQRNTPYTSLIQAFQSLIKQILTESEDQITLWRNKLLTVLAPNAQVIIDVIPELETIIGPQPPLVELDPVETQNRFKLLFQRFISIFAKPQHPLVIFLDDLQWADVASLNLLHLLATAPDTSHLLIIGAYRDNEVTKTHPLMLTLAKLQEAQIPISEIALFPLNSTHITQLVADTFSCSFDKAKPLAELILAKTKGNPFFINEFLKSLYKENLLTFKQSASSDSSPQPTNLSKTDEDGWHWDLTEIQARDITDNVVDLMTTKIQQLSSQTQTALQLSACIGNRFDLETLAIVSQQAPHQVAENLWEAVAEGLINPLGDAYKLATLELDGLADEIDLEYRFVHDRIQLAVYNLISTAQKTAIHHQIGQLLLQKTPPNQQEQKIFDIVNQLNLGQNLLSTQADRNKLAKLNLIAAEKAKDSAAYQPAFDYFKIGQSLLAKDAWQTDYELALTLHSGMAQAAYLIANFAEMTRLNKIILNHAKTLLNKVPVYQIQIQAYTAQNKLREAVQTALQILALLDIKFPTEPTETDMTAWFEATEAILVDKPIASLVDLPQMSDPDKLAALSIISRVFTAVYLTYPTLFPLLIYKMVALSVTHGNAPVSTFAYASYGLTLCGFMNDIERGYQFGQLALTLLDRLDATEYKAKTLEIVNAFIAHWKEPLHNTLQPLLQGYQSGLNTGDLDYAAFCAFVYTYHAFAVGKPLTELEPEINAYSQTMRQLKQETVLNLSEIYRQVILNLMGLSTNPRFLIGSSYDERKMLPLHLEAKDWGTSFHVYFNKLYLCYLFDAYPEAIENASLAEQYLSSVTASFPVPVFYFYDALAWLAMYPQLNKTEQKKALTKINTNQKKLKKWRTHAPSNHAHRHTLVKAEKARVLGKDGKARDYYDQAIELAQKNNYINEEALAHELAAKFYLTKTKSRIAYIYLKDAQQAYLQWGALAKSSDLELKHPDCFAHFSTQDTIQPLTTMFTSTTGLSSGHALDLWSVVKSSQSISSEIELDKLLTSLIKIVIENTGAERGCLVLAQEGKLFIEAEANSKDNSISVLQSVPVQATPDNTFQFSSEIINYVARTRENIVLNNASRIGDFSSTPYIVAHQPKSILCVPLINQGDLLGIIYLENNLTTNAFTSERVEIVQLLGTQATISITNTQAISAKTEQERLQLENQFLEAHSTELAKLNADKDKFFSIVSHDLRSPFNALLGNTEFLLKELDSLSTAQIKRNLQRLHMSSKAAYDLLENLLTWSRLQRGRMDYQPSSVHLQALAQNTIELLAETAHRKNITFSNFISATIYVVADSNMLSTIIRNLTSNALKFTHQGGSVSISATVLALTANEENEDDATQFVEIAVTDTGVGISQENIDKLFDMGVHHSTSGTSNEQGTGLGLIVCYEMVEKHGGGIWVESEIGQGTTFKFTIPLDEISADFPASQAEPPEVETAPALASDTPLLNQTPLIPPPKQDLENLFDYALKGSMRGIRDYAIELEKTNSEFALFAQQLITYANNFDEDSIFALLKKHLTDEK